MAIGGCSHGARPTDGCRTVGDLREGLAGCRAPVPTLDASEYDSGERPDTDAWITDCVEARGDVLGTETEPARRAMDGRRGRRSPR